MRAQLKLFQFCSLPKHTPTLLPPGTNTGLARALADLMVFLMNTVAFNYQHPQPPRAKEEAILGVAGLCLRSGIRACRAPLIRGNCLPASPGMPASSRLLAKSSSRRTPARGNSRRERRWHRCCNCSLGQWVPSRNTRSQMLWGKALACFEFQKPSPTD